jgi:hypothetical protein
MISLKRLLQEQVDDTEYEISAELEEELKQAINQEEDPIALFIAGQYWNAFMASSESKWTAATIGLIALGVFRKPASWLLNKLVKAGAVPIKMVGKQLAINAPWKSFLRLNSEGAAIWTRNAILKPLQTIKKTNQRESKLYQEADRLEGLIKNKTKPANFLELAKSTRKMFESETYNALRKLRDSEGRAYIDDKLQAQFEKLFGELHGINREIFNERYIRTTLESLEISQIQQEKMLSRIFPEYQPKMQQTLLTKSDLQATQKSGTISKPKLSFAQRIYMNTLSIADRRSFAKIVNNLSDEIAKRSSYVDDLMQFDKFPDKLDWENIPGKPNWGLADKELNYKQDELFYHANKYSGNTIK